MAHQSEKPNADSPEESLPRGAAPAPRPSPPCFSPLSFAPQVPPPSFITNFDSATEPSNLAARCPHPSQIAPPPPPPSPPLPLRPSPSPPPPAGETAQPDPLPDVGSAGSGGSKPDGSGRGALSEASPPSSIASETAGASVYWTVGSQGEPPVFGGVAERSSRQTGGPGAGGPGEGARGKPTGTTTGTGTGTGMEAGTEGAQSEAQRSEAKQAALKRALHRSLSVDYSRKAHGRARTEAPATQEGGPQRQVAGCGATLCRGCGEYFDKWGGAGEGIFPPRPTPGIMIWSFVACFVGVAVVALMLYNIYRQFTSSATAFAADLRELLMIVAVFASSAVLIFGLIDAPESQPRNLLLGTLLSLAFGLLVAEGFEAFGYGLTQDTSLLWLEMALAVALSLTAMQVTRTLHSPGGSAAVVVLLLQPSTREHGLYLLFPALVGLGTLLLVALLINNIGRQYPLYWWKPKVAATVITEDLGDDHDFEIFGEAFQAGKLSFNPRNFPGFEDFLSNENYEPPTIGAMSSVRVELERGRSRSHTAPSVPPKTSWFDSAFRV